MNVRQNYESLVDKYKGGIQVVKKLGLFGGIMQFSIILVINSMKHLEMPYYKFIASILFAWAIYSFIKDFWALLRIERNLAQIILDGLELEKRNSSFGNFFGEVLQDFNIMKILTQRSLVNLVAFGCLGYFLSQFVADLNPSFAIGHKPLIFISGILTSFAAKLYYDSLKLLAETKAQVPAK